MPLLSAIAVLAILQAPDQAQVYTTRIAGRDVRWSLAPTQIPSMPDDVLMWDGWGFLDGERQMPGPARQTLLPAGMDERYKEALSKVTGSTPVWRTRVFLISRVDRIMRDSESGQLVPFRTSLDRDIDTILQGLAQYAALAIVAAKGAVKVELSVSIDPDTMYVERDTPVNTTVVEGITSKQLERYCSARVNGPGFVPDDGVFRGPYDNVLVVYPAAPGESMAEALSGWTVLTALPVTADALANIGAVREAALDRWLTAADLKARAFGVDRQDAADPAVFVPALAGGGEPTAEALAQAQALEALPRSEPEVPLGWLDLEPTRTVLTTEQDPDRGSVLSYREGGLARAPGVLSPVGRAAATGGAKSVSFFVKATSPDPLYVEVVSLEGKPRLRSLGGAYLAPRAIGGLTTALFKPDGTWQRVSIPLSGPVSSGSIALRLAPATGDTRERGMAHFWVEKQYPGLIEYAFDDFEFTADEIVPAPALSPALDAASEFERALAVARLGPETPKEELLRATRLLTDRHEIVRLNAAQLFTRVQLPEAEAALMPLTRDLSQRVEQRALMALSHQGSDTAIAAIRRTLGAGVRDLGRETAVQLLTGQSDAGFPGLLSIQVARRSVRLKLAALEALAKNTSEQAPVLIGAFFNQDDPLVRLAATEASSVEVDALRKHLMFNAVNDPSDMVRAASYIKLLDSKDPAVRAEGAKGVRDEGVLTRLRVVRELGSRKNEENRRLLQLAVVDSSPSVRAAALAALGELPKGVSAEEVENTFSDGHPAVQSALLELARSGKLKLPDETLASMKQSPFKAIAGQAARLS